MKNAGASVVGKDNAREFNLPFFTNALIISYRIIPCSSVSKTVRSRGKETLRTKTFNYMRLFEYIDAIRTDNENGECWRSENYLNEKDKIDPNKCIEMVCSAFRYENYHYAESVLFSIIISNINYLEKWFKDLLLEGKGVQNIRDYVNDLYELYAETFDKI